MCYNAGMVAKQKAAKIPAGENSTLGIVMRDGNEVMGWGEVIVWSACALTAVLVVAILHSSEKYYQFFLSVGALATAGGVLFAAWTAKNVARNAEITAQQLKDSNRLTSVNFVVNALSGFVKDDGMLKLFYNITDKTKASKKFKNTDEYFKNNDGVEMNIDKLLSHFAVIAFARKNGFVSDADITLIIYDLLATMKDCEVRKYIKGHLAKAETIHSTDGHPYRVLMEFADSYPSKKRDASCSGCSCGCCVCGFCDCGCCNCGIHAAKPRQ